MRGGGEEEKLGRRRACWLWASCERRAARVLGANQASVLIQKPPSGQCVRAFGRAEHDEA